MFIQRAVNLGNSLNGSVVDAQSMSLFKIEIDRFLDNRKISGQGKSSGKLSWDGRSTMILIEHE